MGKTGKSRKPGKQAKKRVTITDIARHCDVSKATVSRVLSGKLNEFPVSEAMIQRVHEAVKQLDYKPDWMARAISNQCTYLIGLSSIHIDAQDLTADAEAMYDQALGQFSNVILGHPDFKDYDLVLHDRKEPEGQPLQLSDFKSDRLDGMIYLTPSDDHTEFLEMASEDFPIVLLGQVAGAEEKLPCVDINNRKMAKQAVEHLIRLRRRNILMLIPEKLHHIHCIQDRLQGYRDALTANEIQVSDESIHSVRCRQDQVAAFFEDLTCLEEVDAIFCASDDLAAFCIAPLKAMGYRIPEDIALIGFGDDLICQHTHPSLSSVHRSAKKQAHAAIDLLLKILKKEVPYEPGFHEIEAELVIRESTVASKIK